jgi:hypothetical protein
VNFYRTLAIASLSIFLFGCSGPRELPLSQTHEITRFGFSIDYPEGWSVVELGPVTLIGEHRADLQFNFEDELITEGVAMSFEHRPISFLKSLGLKGDPPNLDDLFELNIYELTGMTNPEIEDATLFGEPALRSEYYEEQWDISYAGFVGDEAYFLRVTAPTEEMLADFKPTWEAMLASITPVAE